MKKTTPFRPADFVESAYRNRSLRSLLLASAILTVSVSAAVTDLNGNLTQGLDVAVGFGHTGRLVADTKVLDWDNTFPGDNGTYYSNVDLNGFQLNIDSGGGNGHNYVGAFTGPGRLRFVGRTAADWDLPKDILLSGTNPNTETENLIVRGSINLGKSAGVDALAGPITVTVPSGSTARLIWQEDDQISDLSTIDSTTSVGAFIVQLNGHSDIIESLTLNAGHVVDTGEGGVLSVFALTVGGVPQDPGTYTSADGFVTGTGRVVVAQDGLAADAANSTVVASAPVVANGVETATITVTLLDANSDPAPYKSVSLASSRGGSDTIFPAEAYTNSEGVATFHVKSLASGGPVFTATSNTDSVTVTQTATQTFTENAAVDADFSDVYSYVSEVAAEQPYTTEIAVILVDSEGLPLPGKTVTLSSSRGTTDEISPASVLTDADGVAVFLVGSLTPGEAVFSATVVEDQVELATTATINFLAPILVYDISNDLTPKEPGKPANGVIVDEVVPAGKTGRLVGYTMTHWQTASNFTRTVDLNGYRLYLNNGGGNAMTINGTITGDGEVEYRGGGNLTLNIGGDTGNTYTGASFVTRGPVRLQKTSGNVLNGTVLVSEDPSFPLHSGQAGTGTLLWGASNQVDDASNFTLKRGSFQLDGYSETLGTVTLTGDFNIKLGASTATSQLHFADSSAETWASDKYLTISEWAGALAGDGTEGIFFGDSATGLTEDQLERILFVNPAGLDAGTYAAQILTTGEVVPVGEPLVLDFVNISNLLTPKEPANTSNGIVVDEVVPAGKTGRLVGYTMTYWGTASKFNRTVNLNDHRLYLNNGGGNVMTINGTITGNGEVEYRGGGVQILNIGGDTGNTYTGASFVTRGPVRLQKTSGNVLNGTVLLNETAALHANFAGSGTLLWGASNQVNDASNFTLQSGSFQLDGHSETVGTVALTGDFTIKLGASATTSQLHFADSSAVAWTAGKNLIITEWAGSLAGAGTEGIFFGDSDTGLTEDQLEQIKFLNPAGLDPGTYGAQILSTGEVVPFDAAAVEVVDISNALFPAEATVAEGVNIDVVVPEIKSARLVGLTRTWWNSGGFSRAVDLNENTLEVYTGGGNAFNITGAITGNGVLKIQGGGIRELFFGGPVGNTYTGTTEVQAGPVTLRAASGNALNGSISVIGPVTRTDIFPDGGTLLWGADNQINDLSDLTLAETSSLQLNGHVETLGTLNVTGNTTVKLGAATTSSLRFANSSAIAWTAGKVLTITEWDGDLEGDGTEGIFFGNSDAGLTSDQLEQIVFVNPAGLAAGSYSAQILTTGEVVPVAPEPGATFEDWAATNAGGQTADQDYDGDGVPNGVEYFMGETGSTFTATPQVVTTEGVRTVTWKRDPNVSVPFKVQVSEDLEGWTDYTVPNAMIDESDPNQVVFTLPDDLDKLFVRLVVSPPDVP